MGIPSNNIFFKRAQKRLRLSPQALKARLKHEMELRPYANELAREHEVLMLLQKMCTATPAPLRGVADMATQEKERLSAGLLNHAKQYTRQWLTANKAMAEMREKWEMHMNSLDVLRKDVNGEEEVPEHANLQKGQWKEGRPLEKKLEQKVAAHDAAAYEDKAMHKEMAETALKIIREERLPRYEAAYGETLREVREVLDEFTEAKAVQEALLKHYRKERETLEAEAPLEIAPHCGDLSLKEVQPEASAAQNLAEEAVADAKATCRQQEKLQRQKQKINEVRLVEEQYDKLYPLFLAGEKPAKPYVDPAALGGIQPSSKEQNGEGSKTEQTDSNAEGTKAKELGFDINQPTSPKDFKSLKERIMAELREAREGSNAEAQDNASVEEDTASTASTTSTASTANTASPQEATATPEKADATTATTAQAITSTVAEAPAPEAAAVVDQKPKPITQYKELDDRPKAWQPHHEAIYQQFIDTMFGGVAPMPSYQRDEIFHEIMAENPHPPPGSPPPT